MTTLIIEAVITVVVLAVLWIWLAPRRRFYFLSRDGKTWVRMHSRHSTETCVSVFKKWNRPYMVVWE